MLGVRAGPLVREGYALLFPAPDFSRGDFHALLEQAHAPVVLFSSSTCPWCARTRALLADAGTTYRDYVIDQDEDAHRRFEAAGGDAVPLLFIGDRRIVGFRDRVIREALAGEEATHRPTKPADRP